MRSQITIGLLLLTTLSGCPSKTDGTLSTQSSPLAGAAVAATPAPTISPAAETTEDFLIVPSQGIGPITAESTEATLKERFGADQVKAEKIYVGEGQQRDGVVVYPDQPEKRVEVVWVEGVPDKVEFLQISGKTSNWKTAEGVSLGSSLAELETLNGKPFAMMGLGWDLAGNVTDWRGGSLESMNLRVDATDVELTEEESAQIMGDRIVSSDHPVMRKANPKVSMITMIFARPESSNSAAPLPQTASGSPTPQASSTP